MTRGPAPFEVTPSSAEPDEELAGLVVPRRNDRPAQDYLPPTPEQPASERQLDPDVAARTRARA